MSEQLLTILKLCLLALLYLFFFRVLRAVWAELRAAGNTAAAPAAGRSARVAAAPAAVAVTPTPAPAGAASPAPSGRRAAKGPPVELAVIEPAERRGTAYPVADELTVGRAGGCAIALPEDTFASSIHARVFRDGSQVLVEDLGSTNGTFLNGTKVGAPVPLGRGDRLKIGNTVLEAR